MSSHGKHVSIRNQRNQGIVFGVRGGVASAVVFSFCPFPTILMEDDPPTPSWLKYEPVDLGEARINTGDRDIFTYGFRREDGSKRLSIRVQGNDMHSVFLVSKDELKQFMKLLRKSAKWLR